MTTTVYTATVLMNGRPDSILGYKAGDPLAFDGRTIVNIMAPSADEALDRAFTIGNRQGADDLGITWSSDVRSVSVGDVVYIDKIILDTDGLILDSEAEGHFSIDPIGFTRLTSTPLAELGEGAMVRARAAL